MRPTWWYIMFKSPDGSDGQPAFVQGGRRKRAITRVAWLSPRGWKLAEARRISRPEFMRHEAKR